MKKISFFNLGKGIAPMLGLLMFLSFAPFLSRTTFADDLSLSLGIGGNTDDFSYLAQYGDWMNVEPYGSVWVPNVSSEWRPFTYGHWTWTDQGWSWVSYEPYGWLVFHYGNWDYSPDIGWFWIEGNEWSTARVEWLNYDGYCAWAPMPPAGVSWDEPWESDGLNFWVVIRDHDLDRANIRNYELHSIPGQWEHNRRDIYNHALGLHQFEKIIGHRVERHALRRGPTQVYMNRRHREGFPGRRYGEQLPERRNEPRAEAQHNRETQPEARSHENQHHEGQRAEGHRTEGNSGRYQREENHSAEMPRMENRHEENRSAQRPQMENRHEENNGHQLQRMILPKRDHDRVEKYRPQFERKVMNNNHESRNEHQNQNEGQHHNQTPKGERGRNSEKDRQH